MSLFMYSNRSFQAHDLRRKEFELEEYHHCNFSESRFEKADFLGAIFTDCDFSAADFTRAYITGARFENCDFTYAKFDGAYIFSSNFKNCNFTCATMDSVLLASVEFPGSNFTNVEWEGIPINRPPVLVQGIGNHIVALDNGHMHIGCRYGDYDWFWNCPDREVSAMEGLKSRRFWKKNKKWIFDMLKAQDLYVHPET